MWISRVEIVNIRSFENSGYIPFSKGLNVLVGPNNSGKSTILKALYGLQSESFSDGDVRNGQEKGEFEVLLCDYADERFNFLKRTTGELPLRREFGNVAGPLRSPHVRRIDGPEVFPHFPSLEPNNFIYPFSAKRKVLNIDQNVSIEPTNRVVDNLTYLTAKVDRIRDRNHPSFEDFDDACKEILGFSVSTYPSTGGKQIGIVVGESVIPLERMGEGTAHLLGLITALITAQGKLFIVEELENDIHPKALKALLKLIAEKAHDN